MSPSRPQPSQPVTLAQGSTLQTSGGQTEGMERSNAIAGLCDGICASRMIAEPRTSSAVHHHGDQDTVIFCASGSGGAITSEGGRKRTPLAPGDFCLIPAWTEHQEVNDGDDKLVLCVVRSGRSPKVVNLTGWEGDEA